MTKLSVNVNKVALLRNARAGQVPSVVRAAEMALNSGAAGVTVHPRPDERHIHRTDCDDLAALLDQTPYRRFEFNIEGNPFVGDYLAIIRSLRPTQCTLVPDDPGALTSDHGWNIEAERGRLQPLIAELRELGCRVSLFMDPVPAMIEMVPATGADRIELYTESYAKAYEQSGDVLKDVFDRFAEAARTAGQLGLGVNAGHDLSLSNLGRFVTIPGILEVSIGHALIADALEMGIANAVKAYLALLK